jgi:hypothetical protein
MSILNDCEIKGGRYGTSYNEKRLNFAFSILVSRI